jgi:1-acyl-sn-glycerol-3-phosphate acyltransferase
MGNPAIPAAKRPIWKALYPWDPEAFWRPIIVWLTRKILKPHYIGFDQIPKTGPCLLISNHVSYLDGLILTAACDRPIRFVIDGNIYKMPGVHFFMKHGRAIPVLPTRESVTAMLEEVAAGLAAGDAIGLFPEGQLTYTGSLGRFRPGIEWIIKRTPVPVYPVALVGLWGSIFSRKYRKSRFRWFPRHWGKPIIAVCGHALKPEEINVNSLQRVILGLKHKASRIEETLE